ncbi:hypothetical protein [uncultured Microbulbifer sp.]|uniref:hypothetical protein n=1 Tax=uncultured Microbulbifer sp. TaxID=348147 RepID=UPI002627A170|nr:hypothetical protein [uncultured Microbulbifer sp.]
MSKKANAYEQLIEQIFFDSYSDGDTRVAFERSDIEGAADHLGINLPKNLGDVIYSFRYRKPLPQSILNLQTEEMEWVIEGVGRAKYEFKLVRINRILPNPDLITIKVPDATPEIVNEYALSDEQALLAKVRYNRLIDIFLGITTYSLQNHLRTTVRRGVQIEIDELYAGIDPDGCQYIIPVQAKGGSDQLGVVQTKQDIDCCQEKFPTLVTRAISTQFIDDARIALFELTVQDDHVRIVHEKHYELVSSGDITEEDLRTYRNTARARR